MELIKEKSSFELNVLGEHEMTIIRVINLVEQDWHYKPNSN